MVIRSTIQCGSCDSKFITRTQVGHKEQQEHSFPCPECGVLLSLVLDLDQKEGEFRFREHDQTEKSNDTIDEHWNAEYYEEYGHPHVFSLGVLACSQRDESSKAT